MVEAVMKTTLYLILGCATGVLAMPPEEDRNAILAMAGSFEVSFRFKEIKSLNDHYTIKEKAYEANATEIVTVVEDSPEKIALQHLLVVFDKEKKSHVIKHWAQIWTWEDKELLDYSGEEQDHEWEKVRISEKDVSGHWSQLVTQIDDTPRYESIGKWKHENGVSTWESGTTRRPLPRREYTKRDDYDYIVATNRHVVTKDGWRHEQDNNKVVDREGEEKQTLCKETGLNIYKRVETEHTKTALDWWEERQLVWNHIRNFWEQEGETEGKLFSYTTMKKEVSLNDKIKSLHEMKGDFLVVSNELKLYLIQK